MTDSQHIDAITDAIRVYPPVVIDRIDTPAERRLAGDIWERLHITERRPADDRDVVAIEAAISEYDERCPNGALEAWR